MFFHTSLKIIKFLVLIKNDLQVPFQSSFRHIPQTVFDWNNNFTLIDEIFIEHLFIRMQKINLQLDCQSPFVMLLLIRRRSLFYYPFIKTVNCNSE
jgi:hypothetical protein